MNTQKKSKTSATRQNKGHHIDVRFTEKEYNLIITQAAKCGMHKSNYVHDTVLGHQPKQLMTDEQEEAWIEGVNYLIQHWDTIKDKFGG